MDVDVAAAAGRLHAARAEGATCRPVRDLIGCDVSIAYEVQARFVRQRVADGARAVGRKIGLTSPAVQAQLHVDQPDFGVLFDDMRCFQDVPVDLDRLLQPKIEAEVAFILTADLDLPRVTEADVVAATGRVVAALEIVDSRIAGWDITIADTVADNGSAALFVLGDDQVSLDGLDLTCVQMTMRCGEDTVSSGTGADCLGNPLTAVAWLANTARDYGAPLRAGDIVLSGALGPMAPVAPGSAFLADITGVGHVHVSFTNDAPSRRDA